MNEKLILDYLIANNMKIYDDSYVIDNISTAGEWVMFSEVSSCGHYKDQLMIPLFDVVAWVYSKISDS